MSQIQCSCAVHEWGGVRGTDRKGEKLLNLSREGSGATDAERDTDQNIAAAIKAKHPKSKPVPPSKKTSVLTPEMQAKLVLVV